MSISARVMLLTAACPMGCHCADRDAFDTESLTSSSSETSTTATVSSDTSTGEPFDASRWIGRYHVENPFLPFGERGDPLGTYSLVNFEVLPGSRATMLYDDCARVEPPIEILYEWIPDDEDGWLTLYPGPGEPSLRFAAAEDFETLRVHLIEPCRELKFELDGWVDGGMPFRPGESCWVDRCTTPGIMQVDYCEGEEPPPCP